MINVQQITSKLRMMPDQQLQQYAMQNKDDPYTVSLALSEANTRKQMRADQQAKMAGMQPPTVVDKDIAAMDPTAMVQQNAARPQALPQPQMPSAQLPENVGIGQLPAPSIQNMADGGIVGYADGGEIQSFRSGGSPEEDAFNQAFLRTLKYEGGRTKDTGGDTKYGISKKANPDVDIDKLTVEQARRIYKERYWDAISGDKLAARDPKLAQIAFDTAVNQSPAKAKEFVTASGGDPSKYMQLRGEHYDNLVQQDPKTYGKYAKGWASRLGNLATDLAIPSAIAGETPKPAPAAAPTTPVASNEIPQAVDFSKPAQSTAAPVAPRSQWQAMLDAGRGIVGAGETALQYGTGMLAIPTAGVASLLGSKTTPEAEEKYRKYAGEVTYQPRTEAGQEISEKTRQALEDLKIPPILAHAGSLPPRAGRVGIPAAEIEGLANRLTQESKLQRLAGPTTSETMVQGQGQPPVRQAPASRQYQTDLENAAAFRDLASSGEASKDIPGTRPEIVERNAQLARAQAVAAGASPASTAGIATLGADTTRDKGIPMDDLGFDTSGLDALNKTEKKEITDVAKAALPKGKSSDFSNDFLLSLGLNLMAGQSPNFLTNLGQAGIGALKYTQEAKKESAEEAYKQAMASHHMALSKSAGMPTEVQMLEYLKNPKNMAAYMQQREAMREPMTKEGLFKQFMASTQGMTAKPEEIGPAFQNYVKSYESVMGPLSGSGAGFKVLGSRPG
jgi:lysozyme family protein